MREMGIWGLAPSPQTSTPPPEHKIYPYLLKEITAAYPDHVWGIEITYSTASPWMALFGGRDRWVFPLCGVVGIAVCPGGRATGAVSGRPDHLES